MLRCVDLPAGAARETLEVFCENFGEEAYAALTLVERFDIEPYSDFQPDDQTL